MKFLRKISELLFKGNTDKKSFSTIIIPSFIIHGIAAILGFTLVFVLTRKLGARGYGIYTYALAIAGVFTKLNGIGINGMVVRETSSLLSKNKMALWKGFYKWSLKTLLRNCFIITAIAVLFILISVYGLHLFRETAYTKPVLIALILAPFLGLMGYYSSLLKGRHKILSSLLPDNVIKPATFLLLLAFVIIFYGKLHVMRVILLYVIAVFTGLCFVIVLFKRTAQAKNIVPEYDLITWKRSMLPFAFIAIAGSLFSKVDVLMLGFLKNPASVGIYASADKIAGYLTVFISIMTQISSPAVARLNALDEKAKLQKALTKSIRWIFLCSAFFYLMVVIFSKSIMLYFGPGFLGGQYALIIIATGQLISIAFGPVGMISVMTGNERLTAIFMSVSIILNITLNFILVPLYGINGTAISTTLVLIFWNLSMFILVKKKTGIRTWILG